MSIVWLWAEGPGNRRNQSKAPESRLDAGPARGASPQALLRASLDLPVLSSRFGGRRDRLFLMTERGEKSND